MRDATSGTIPRVAILEWICGGGLTRQELQAASSLRAEGQAMLECVVKEALDAGYETVVALHASLQAVPAASGQLVHVQWIQDGQQGRIAEHWLQLARTCELALVIAPEINGELVSICAALRRAGVALHNCGPELLRVCSEKWETAEWLQCAGVPHPPTQRLAQISKQWLGETQRRFGNQDWALKPSDGAGCEGLQMLEHPLSPALLADWQANGNQQLIQPWIAGQAFSQSAVVDRQGTWHWQPLMTQEMERRPHSNPAGSTDSANVFSETLVYRGGKLADHQATTDDLARLRQQLSRLPWAEQALGWISFDLVQEEKSGSWYVIEANARCSTSMCTLQHDQPLGLFAKVAAAQKG